MNLTLTLRTLMSTLLLAAPAVQAQTPSDFDTAMQAYAHMHFRQAFDGLARLADDGHADAARIALLMASHGPRLFGQRFGVAPLRRERWLDTASAVYPQLAARPGQDHSAQR